MNHNNLISAASFLPNSLQVPNAWVGHLPFAAWLINEVAPKIFVELGTHSGNSYFAFCQSVVENNLSSKCYAVDTWQGDEHAGQYEDSIFLAVNSHNEDRYAGFSRLLRTTFDNAVNHFADASIELLHIDGLHTYEAVRHDFETWLPKLAPGAIVMFHDTNVRERDFGVWKLWEELQAIYPSNIEFLHSNGLGVLQLNNAPAEKKLACLNSPAAEKKLFVNFFAALGARQLERFDLSWQYKPQLVNLEQVIHNKDVHIGNLDSQIFHLNQAVATRDGRIANLNQIIFDKDVHINNLDLMLHDKDVHIRNLDQIALDRISMLQEMKASTSWRITAPIRNIASVFIRNRKRIQLVNSLLPSYIDSCGGLIPAVIKVAKVLKRDGWSGLVKRVLILKARSGTPIENSQLTASSYGNYIATMEPSADDLKAMGKIAQNFTYQPKFSIAVPVYNVDAQWLTAFIESVLAQIYANWELCIADDHSIEPHVRPLLESYAAKDKRIKLVFRETNGHISAATNSALELATGDFVCLMDNDDEIAAHALFEFASLLNRDSALDMIYSDEDKLDMAGNRYEPFFKPDWSPEALEGCMYTAHFACYRMSLVRELSGFRSEFNGAQDYDFVLRFTERATKIAHIPKVLYHWRAIPGSTAASMDAKDYVLDSAVRALTERAKRVAGGGETRLGAYSGSFDLRYKISDSPLVSIVIPSAGRMAHVRGKDVDLLSQVIISIYEKTTYRNFEIIIVDNNDLRIETIEAIKPYNCQFVHFEGKFNIATKMNMGAKVARGEYLLFMNDDIEVITPDWMECMLQLCQRKGVGAVGAKLHYENESLQHVGIAFWNGLPDHIHRAYPGNYPGHLFSAVANRNYLAVTGAVLMTKQELFKSVGGFDERFAINYNDIDYCLKVFKEGFRIVFAAGAQLCHYESVSREAVVAQDEINLFQQKWKDVLTNDPYYSVYFDNHPPVFALRHDWTAVPSFDPLKSPVISHV
ncbi:MAG: glycosyltransferase [Gallionella sp.]|nr:glycosyltransferase [Gallionella sp.]